MGSELVWESWNSFTGSHEDAAEEPSSDRVSGAPSNGEITCVIEKDEALTPIISLIEKGDLEQAYGSLKSFLERRPEHAGAHKWLGLLLRHRHDKQALEHLRQWRDAEGSGPEARFECGDALLEFGRYGEAEANYRHLLSSPHMVGALIEMAQARVFQGKPFVYLLDAAYSIDARRTRRYIGEMWTFPRSKVEAENPWSLAIAAAYLGVGKGDLAELAEAGRVPVRVGIGDEPWSFSGGELSAFADLMNRYSLRDPAYGKNQHEAEVLAGT